METNMMILKRRFFIPVGIIVFAFTSCYDCPTCPPEKATNVSVPCFSNIICEIFKSVLYLGGLVISLYVIFIIVSFVYQYLKKIIR